MKGMAALLQHVVEEIFQTPLIRGKCPRIFRKKTPMTRKRLETRRSDKPPDFDDLKLINGIGPAVEKRLNGVGIFTFAQLAALSPADIAAAVSGITGLTTERIIKQDWIGQAHQLAALKETSASQEDAETLLKSMPQTIAVSETHKEIPISASEDSIQLSIARNLPSILRLSELKTTLAGVGIPFNVISSVQKYETQITLDFTDVAVLSGSDFNYTVSFYGRNLDGGARNMLGIARGSIKPADKVSISIEGERLPAGIYRLEAEAEVSPLSIPEETSPQQKFSTWARGNFFEIYDLSVEG